MARQVVTSAARTASGDSGRIQAGGEASAASSISLLVNVTAASGATPALDLDVEWTPDGGTTYFPAETADSFTQITAVTKVAKRFECKSDDYRIVWTIGGATPSFTFSVHEYAV